MKVIDLSYLINKNTQLSPFDPQPRIEAFHEIENEGIDVKMLTFVTHTGTHMDAPSHIIKDSRSINDFDIEQFIGQGVLIDLSDRGARYEIEYKDIMTFKDNICEGDFVILKTGWAKYNGTADFFDHPFLGEGGATALVELGVSLVGTDGGSIDAAYGLSVALKAGARTAEELLSYTTHDNFGGPAHEIILGADMLIVEYLCNLDEIDKNKGMYSFLPIKIDGADGAPVRAVYFSNE